MVPNGWKLKSFEKAGIKVVDGDRGKEYPKSTDFHDDGYCLFLSAKNVTKNGFLFEENQFISEDKHLRLRKGIVNRGDVVLTTRGSVGNFALYNGSVPFNCLRINSGMVTLDSSESSIDRDYFYTVCRSHLIGNQIDAVAFGSAQPQLTVKLIKNLKLPIPPLPEQQKIAKILSTWDKAITTTEKLIETSQQQKKALMQQLLTGKKRLVNPETGKVFDGDWEEVKLSKLCSRLTEKNKGQSDNVVTISAQHGLIRQEEFFKKSVASETLDNYFILRKGQFAYNKSYSNGYPMGAIKRLNRYEDAVVTSLYICFEIKNHKNTSSCFLEQYFESGLLNRGLTKVAAEGGRAHGLLNVKPADFMALSLHIPVFKEQQKIASVLTAADKEIELLEAKLAHLKDEKKALMQQLLTGKRRVKIEATEVA